VRPIPGGEQIPPGFSAIHVKTTSGGVSMMGRPRAATVWVGVCLFLVSGAGVARGADWFVAPGSAGGDGTKQKPFPDPWHALAVATPGDSIHISEGTYHGRHDRSIWEIDRPRITLLGGYDRGFTRRDPWKQPSVFAFYRDYEGTSENNLLWGRDDHSGVVLDGLAFDGGGRNRYDPKPPFGLRGGLGLVGPLVNLSSPDVIIRNCVFVNSLSGAAELRGEGSRFENNLVVNHHGSAMLVLRDPLAAKRPMVVRGNTFAFAFDDSDPPMGKGGEKGIGIRVHASAQIENNVFLACGNAALLVFVKPDRVTLDDNVFSLSLRANVALKYGGTESLIADKNVEELEDLAFKSSKGNRVADVTPTALTPEWLDGVTRHLLLAYAKPPKDGLKVLRTSHGLGEVLKPAADDIGPVAPYIDARDAGALRVKGDAGAKPIELKVQLAAPVVPAAIPKYTRIEWADLNSGAAGLEGKRVEVRVGLGNERHGFVLKGITQEQFLGFDVYHPGGDRFPDQIHVYSVRHGAAHRQWQETHKSNNAREIENWYLIRGVCKLTGARQKATIQVESVVPTDAPPKAKPARPKGRDWYVRAGAAGGDGSRDKPFRDPFQPLEKAAPGDTIRVAAGDYFGKLRSANWKVGTKHLTFLGGYSVDFAQRDPWKNPTRLVMAPPDPESKDRPKHSGEFLESSDPCDGLELDGFVFDGSTVNSYFDAGAGGLNLRGSPFGSMIKLRGAELTVRNCVFVNASGTAVELNAPEGAFENNVVVNTSGMALSIRSQGAGVWTVRRNTLLFALDPTPRAGTGQSSAAGCLLHVTGRAAVRFEGNILGFADNYSVRATVARDKLRMDGNAFGPALFCQFTDANRVWLDDTIWDRRLADAALASARDNTVSLPAGLPIDRDYADKVLPRLFDLKGRYKREDWVRIAAVVGSSAAPPPEHAVPMGVEKPKPEKPKEQSLDDLAAELEKLKRDTSKPTEPKAPNGPPYAPAYPWRKALELARKGAAVGARQEP
jgi:hypothetical protein